MVKIAVIGFGNIGGGLVEVISKNKEIIKRDLGTELEVKYIVDIRDFKGHPLEHKIIKDFNVVLNDPEVEIVAEMIGGSHPAVDFSLAAMKAGKHVVSSNKEVVANFGEVLLETARENGVAYLFEAAVGGAIPIIRPMRESLSSDNILSVNGILNGTTNFILTQMLTANTSFDDALKQAQALGYAEANPSADVDGIDACRKICILAALAYGVIYPCDAVSTEGITKISKRDAADAAKIGCAIKLIAHCERVDGKPLICVSPRIIPASNPLYAVVDVFNGIMVSGSAVGDLMFYGRGAGSLPTAGAVLADIVEVVKHMGTKQLPPPVWTRGDASSLADAKTAKSAFYCRIESDTVPEGCTVVSNYAGEISFTTGVISEYELDELVKGYKVVSKIRFFA